MYCFDTDVLSAVLRKQPMLHVVRRLALVPPREQFTTAINLSRVPGLVIENWIAT